MSLRATKISLPFLIVAVVMHGLSISTMAQGDQQSYSNWTYDATNQRYTCAFNVTQPNQPAQQQTVVYLPSRPDYFFYYDPALRSYWARCATMHHPSSKPSQTQWSRFENNQWTALSTTAVTVPMMRNGPAITPPELPVAEYDPNAPLDLGPAIEDARQVFVDSGLPIDWYLTLQRGNEPGTLEGEYPLYLTGVWEMVKSEVTRRFCRQFQTRRAPTSELYNGSIGSDNPAFEEMMLLTLIGPDHQHRMYQIIMLQRFVSLPNLDPNFIKRDGAVNFVAIQEAFANRFRQVETLGVNDNETMANDRNETCRVYSEWHVPEGAPPAWAKQQLAARTVIRVEFVEGKRRVPKYEISGNRRLAVGSYIQIGYRKDASQNYQPIFLAGPYHEENYQPVGAAQVGLTAWSMAWAKRDCKKSYVYRDLDSLNVDPDPIEEQEIAERLVAEQTPVAERPSLVSVGDNPRAEMSSLHQQLHEILSPGKPAVPGLPKPTPLPAPAPPAAPVP